ncbi:MAG TPA: hypothetical protein VGQ83_31400 [Polyangia bacterium]|jgi:hypothetical protein
MALARSLLVVCALAAGCVEETAPPSAGRHAVMSGATSPDELGFAIDRLQRNAAAGQLVEQGGTRYQGCSGTLVGDRVVISAAHCVVMNQQEWFNGADPELAPADALFYAIGDDVRAPACLLAAESVHLHPQAHVDQYGAIAHDASVTILKDSAVATCPAAVPVQLNRDPLGEDFVGREALQGGFGALDASYRFSPLRYWSLLRIAALAPDYVVVQSAGGHGFPSFGDSGSGLLWRFPDGSLRTLGIDSLGEGAGGTFVRVDNQAALLDAVVTPELTCGPVGPGGLCRDGVVIACGAQGFTSLDCAASGRDCAIDAQGQAGCACTCDTEPYCQADCPCDAACPCACDVSDACDPGCTCDPQCWPPACACNLGPGCDPGCACDPECACEAGPAAGCSVTPAAGRASPLLVVAALLLFLLGGWWRRRFGLLGAGVILGVAGLAAGCSDSTTLVCHARDGGAVVDAVADGAGEDAAGPGPDGACVTVNDLLAPGACGDGWACDRIDFVSGAVGCRPAGPAEAYSACTPVTPACPGGMSCIGSSPTKMRCLPFCPVGATSGCPGDGLCVYSVNTSAGEVGLCTPPEACDPVSHWTCAAGEGCYFVDARTYCLPGGGGTAGAACQSGEQCAPGFGCQGPAPAHCAAWCRSNTQCDAPATCQGIGTVPGYDNLGWCG